MAGIAVNLQDFAEDEGLHSALAKAENWRDTLEEMQEICNTRQREACNTLLLSIRTFIKNNK